MTRIEFYFNVVNKNELIESLVQHALLKRRLITILTVDAHMSANVSEYIWQNKPTSFLPNIQANLNIKTEQAVLLNQQALTPVVIGSQVSELNQDDLLINLTMDEPGFFSRFTQLIEIIGLENQDKLAGRQRYKFYRDRGYEIKNIDHANMS